MPSTSKTGFNKFNNEFKTLPYLKAAIEDLGNLDWAKFKLKFSENNY